jgi:hypothetical protein
MNGAAADSEPGIVRRAGVAIASVLAGFAVLLFALGGEGARNRGDAFLTLPQGADGDASARQKLPFVLKNEASENGWQKYVGRFRTGDPARLAGASKISLLLLTGGPVAAVETAKLTVTEESTGRVLARFRAVSGSKIRNNRTLEFVRKAGASPDAAGERGLDSIGPGALVTLKITSRGSALVGVWTEQTKDAPLSNILWTATDVPGIGAGFASLYGWSAVEPTAAACSRAGLLGAMWGWDPAGRGRAAIFAICCAMLVSVAGAALIAGFPNRCGPLPLVAGSCLLYAGLALAYAVIIPPFHAPDEADHFLTFAYAQRERVPTLEADGLAFANAGHFERIKFRTEEKFAASDLGHPMTGGWASHVIRNDIWRSPVGLVVWSLVGSVIRPERVGSAVLALRLANILFVAACLAVSLTVAVWALHPSAPSAVLAAPVLLAPSVLFFGTAVSNYPFLIGGCLFQIVAFWLLWAAGSIEGRALRRLHSAVGLLAGAGIVIAIGSSDNGVFGTAFWVVLLPAYWFLRGVRSESFAECLGGWARFFVGFVSALVAGWAVIWQATGNPHIIPEFLTWHVNRILGGSPLRGLDSQIFVAAGFLVPLTLASLAGSAAGFCLRNWPHLRRARTAVIAMSALSLLFVLFAPGEQIPPVANSGGAAHYIVRVVSSFFEGLGPGGTDWLVVRSFWGEFGWLDAPLPDIVVDVLRLGTGAGLVLLFFTSLKNRTAFGGIGFFFGTITALAVCAAVIGAGYYMVRFGVHGRYLIGLYLFAMAAAAEGYRRTDAFLPGDFSGRVPAGALICIVGIGLHCSAWCAVLGRYF